MSLIANCPPKVPLYRVGFDVHYQKDDINTYIARNGKTLNTTKTLTFDSQAKVYVTQTSGTQTVSYTTDIKPKSRGSSSNVKVGGLMTSDKVMSKTPKTLWTACNKFDNNAYEVKVTLNMEDYKPVKFQYVLNCVK